MLNLVKFRTVIFLITTLISAGVAAQQPVIPGAAGYGINTPAGRGGTIFRVTNLNDSGQGSLRECVKASGPRYCIFEVSGSIRLDSDLVVSSPNLTIAGQTAPSPGILLRDYALKIKASDVLVQHLQSRVGADPADPNSNNRQPLKINGVEPIQNVIVDHCSISWAVDENISTALSWDNITISNTIISEPLRDAGSSTGSHGYSALINNGGRSSKIALIGNLFAHGHARNPRSAASDFVFVNNVVYNAGNSAVMLYNTAGIRSKNDIVGNVFIHGPNTIATPIRLTGPNDGKGTNEILSGTKVYLSDNLADNMTSDQWSLVYNKSNIGESELKSNTALSWPSGLEPLPTSGGVTIDQVLQNAGSRPAQRNSVDARIISNVINKTGKIINCVEDDGTSRCAKNAGGWPQLASNVRSLSVPNNPNGDGDGDGYTNLEEWLHQMAAEVEGRSGSTQPLAVAPNPPLWQE